MSLMENDVIIIGAGYAGSVAARQFAQANKKVLLIEKRNHIGGNAYDYLDENGVMRHQYGPHIFHTNYLEVYEYLSRFTDWHPYRHSVLGLVQDKFVPIPFNLRSIEMCFNDDEARHIIGVLTNKYAIGSKVTILELQEDEDPTIKKLADFIFENVFKYYTMKQWNLNVEQLDPKVISRVPVSITYDNYYFTNTYQAIPLNGYTKMFEKILNHKNIKVLLNTDCKEHLKIKDKKIYFDNEEYKGIVVYTGILDELFDYSLGALSYRSLDFEYKTVEGDYQDSATVNYPTPKQRHPFTRISEYKKFMANPPIDKSTIAIEYPYDYDPKAIKGNIPYYPVFTDESKNKYNEYLKLLNEIDNLYALGRLAEYKYYDMDAITLRAMEFVKEIING